MKQVIIDYSNNSITYVNDKIGFSQFGIAKEILNLIESEEKEIERYKLIIKALEKHFTDLEYYEDNEFLRQLLSVTDNDMIWLKRMAGDDKE